MIKKTFLFLTAFILNNPYALAQEHKGFIVAELYTSQSCSSCPAADKLLGDISKNPNIIALSCHITYWDHLNWKDTLSREFCSKRQKDYAFNLTGKGRVYTPQLVINGKTEVAGHNEAKVQNAIQEFDRKRLPEIKLKQTASGIVQVTLPKLESSEYDLIMVSYKNSHIQPVPSGENRGRTITSTNAVLDMQNLGHWQGGDDLRSYDITKFKGTADGIVIWAQKSRGGEIKAAGRISL